ncbi:hypothetical protein [Haladaptatus salinisoli]|uniref:hypothetical protein n=1 Tax=Haladaptatus salinisoli TaxID=2884876 RepID=UPI001D0BD831|nr:hypothetical protein [Haladaptatus salinisoli]
MNSKELLGIVLLIVGTVLIIGVSTMTGSLVTNVLAGLSTLALAGGALMYGTAEDGRPV